MRNFHKLSGGIAVGPLMATIARHGELWNQDTLRTSIPGGPHRDIGDILLRFGAPDIDDIGPCKNREPMRLLGAMGLSLNIMQLVGGSELGRVVITRLEPGCKILPHADEGAYARRMTRHQLMLNCAPGVSFICGGETFCAQTGDLFWFNSSLEHSVINNGAESRIAMIVDCRID